MKFLLCAASGVALLFAIAGPLLLASLPLWTGQGIGWTQLDLRPWLALGPWAVPVWTPGFTQDLVVALVLYGVVLSGVWLLHQAWHDLTRAHAEQLRHSTQS